MRAFVLPVSLAALAAFAPPLRAESFHTAIVRGAKVVAQEDILLTCGPLTGIDLDDYDFRDIEACLKSTGVFDDVKVIPEGDVLAVVVREVPTKPGRFDIGLAWSNDDRIRGEFSYSQFDLIPDSYLAIDGSVSRERKAYGAKILRENAFGEGLHFSFKLEGQASDYDDLPYQSDTDQLEAGLIWIPTDLPLRADLGLGYRSQKMFALDAAASPLFAQSMQRISAPFVHIGLSMDQGGGEDALQSRWSLDQYVWNLGTDRRILDLRFSGDLQYQVTEKNRVLLGIESGVTLPRAGSPLNALDRAYLGGDRLRGFALRGIGPADYGDLLGGMRYAGLSLEVQRELTLFEDSSFTGGAFVDIGSVWGLSDTDGGRVDDGFKLRSSIGLSATFKVGETPVAFYIAKPLKKQAYDDVQYFGLTVQTSF